jgi:hypothetical protein
MLVPSSSTGHLLAQVRRLLSLGFKWAEIDPSPTSGLELKNDQEGELVELGGGNADLQLGVLEAEGQLRER